MREIEGVDRTQFIVILFMDTENFTFLYNTSLLLITTQVSLPKPMVIDGRFQSSVLSFEIIVTCVH